MTRHVARYTILFGVTGCMPNSNYVVEFARRKDLADFIRSELTEYGFPQSCIRRETKGIREIWRFIQRNGSSSAHFSFHHKGHALEFVGMTDAEWQEREVENDD